MLKNIGQSRWLKGLNAAFNTLSSPKGTVPRVSNMVLTIRGSWITCDGSQIISELDGIIHPTADNIGPITEFFLYQPVNDTFNYFLIRKDYNTHLGAPVGLVTADGGAGGSLSAGTYKWMVTALDGAGGETVASAASAPLVLAGSHKGNVSWTAKANATGYNLYRTKVNGSIFFLVNGTTPIATNSYLDNISDLLLGTLQPPGTDTTQTCVFQEVPATSYGAANTIFTFPADELPLEKGPGGGTGGGAGPGGGGGGPPQPTGGVAGNLSPIPQIVQFANLMFLALGNGITPYTSDGTNPNTDPITNTFSATYPIWAATTGFSTGDLIQSGGNIFTAIQGGVSGGAPPVFPATLGKTVADGPIIWKNTGSVGTSPAPRGAAHVEVYAGSVWVANTSPSITADQLDGPSAVRMSDANNPNSWNPLNAAQVAKDDGQQIQAIKAFAVAAAGIPTSNQLAVFKDFSTYIINGVFGASDFSIQQAQTDMGCVSPRSVQYLPGFGIMRFTHLGFSIFDGLYDKVVSEDIRPYLFGGEPDIVPVDWNYMWFAKGAQVANPPMYICACPLQGASQAGLFSTLAINVVAGTPTLGAGTFYFKIQGTLPSGDVVTSGEFVVPVPVVVGGAVINISFPGATAFTSWRAYYIESTLGSPGPGAENSFLQYPGSQISAIINGASVPTSGTPATSLGGKLSRLFCYDLVLKAWTIVDLPFPVSAIHQIRASGSTPITVMAGFSDGAIRRWQAGDVQWDEGATNANAPDLQVRGNFETAEIADEGGTLRIFFRRIVMRGVGNNPQISVVPTYNGQDDTAITPSFVTLGANQFEARVDLMRTVENFHATISVVGPCEIDSVEHEAVTKAVGGALVIS